MRKTAHKGLPVQACKEKHAATRSHGVKHVPSMLVVPCLQDGISGSATVRGSRYFIKIASLKNNLSQLNKLKTLYIHNRDWFIFIFFTNWLFFSLTVHYIMVQIYKEFSFFIFKCDTTFVRGRKSTEYFLDVPGIEKV